MRRKLRKAEILRQFQVTHSMVSGQPQLVTRYTRSHCFDNLIPGDLIQIQRLTFEHWAVFRGWIQNEPYVIHYTKGDKKETKKKFLIKMEPLKSAIDRCKWRVNNGWDEDWKPFSSEGIVQRALDMVNKAGYSLFKNNCEHFAKYCRYGKKDSFQARAVRRTVPYVVTAEIGIVAAVFIPAALGIPIVGIPIVLAVGAVNAFAAYLASKHCPSVEQTE